MVVANKSKLATTVCAAVV